MSRFRTNSSRDEVSANVDGGWKWSLTRKFAAASRLCLSQNGARREMARADFGAMAAEMV